MEVMGIGEMGEGEGEGERGREKIERYIGIHREK